MMDFTGDLMMNEVTVETGLDSMRLDIDMSSGPSSKNLTEDSGVKHARNRFRNVLKHMVQDTLILEDEEGSGSDPDTKIHEYKYNGGPGGSLGPPGSKRKKGSEPEKAQQPTFVMKLFDRGVDLAQFNDKSPLYPICRAWIENKPHGPRRAPTEPELESDPELDFAEETEEVSRLPPPEPLPVDEFGEQLTFRVPPPLPRSDEPFDINYEQDTAPSPALLFQEHLDRWNLIRHRWKEATAYNETRYTRSFGILRNIYHRNRPEPQDTGSAADAGGTEDPEKMFTENEDESNIFLA